MAAAESDRNLLFGILALQMDFITRDALVEAMNAWLVQKHRPLGDILEERGALAPADRGLLEPLVRRHVQQHGDDPARSLAALSSVTSIRRGLGAIADPEVAASLLRLGSARAGEDDPFATLTASVGEASVASQRFRILRPHASGGLGEVFVARDAELNREVALKQIKDSYADHPESRSRFLLEAEITGGLEHPGIVPVYGLGADGVGRPYYAMRFIKGDSLKDAINRFHKHQAARRDAGARMLELQKLLRRFLDVCNALAYAHSRGVLHRDIKPGNIMVGQYGETLVVDWGLAKVVGRSDESSPEVSLRPLSAIGSGETQPGSAIGTPAFMSPEQAEGRLDRLGPASDVYSLGATLYCLLTGRVPVEEREMAAALERVRKGEITPPHQLKPDVPRALEAVCLKAMALKPEARYPTPRALADDLERWLADEPVSAWSEPLAVRTRRWARRHRNLVTILIAGIIMASIGLGYVAMVESDARTKVEEAFTKQSRARAIAEGRLNLAIEAVNAYHNEVSEDILLKRAEFGELRKKLLEWPLSFYQKVSDLPGPENQDSKNLAAIAERLARLGLITRDVGTQEKAIECFQKAKTLLERLHSANPNDVKTRLDLAFNHNQIASSLTALGRYPEALEEYQIALRIRQELSREDPQSKPIKYWVANVHGNIGMLLENRGRRKEALESYQRALAIRETLVRDEPESVGFLDVLGSSYLNMYDLQEGSLKLQWALKAVAIYEEVMRRAPNDSNNRHCLSNALRALGNTYWEARQSADAERLWRKALELAESLVREFPTNTSYRETLSWLLHNLAECEFTNGRTDQGLEMLQRAAEIMERLIEDDPGIKHRRRFLASWHIRIAKILREKGRIDDADRSLSKAQEQSELILKEAPKDTESQGELGTTLRTVASDCYNSRDYPRAIDYSRRAIAVYTELIAAHPELLNHRRNLAAVYNTLGSALWFTKDYRDSAEAHRQGNLIYTELLKTNPKDLTVGHGLAVCQSNLGNSYREAGDTDRTVESYRQAIATASELVLASPDFSGYRITLARTSDSLGWVLYNRSRHSEARLAFRQAIDQARVAFDREPQVGEHRRILSEAYQGLTRSLRALGEADEAVQVNRASKAMWQGHPSELYRIACDLALCVPTATDSGRKAAIVAEAIGTLREAIAAGWNDARRTSGDPALASLRDKDDFRRLVAELFDRVFPADPFAR
jgi:eukaryotic-like serine/threonine-protein kinase